MTRSVYLLAFIASATVVSAKMTWTLTTEQACTAIGTHFCYDTQYTKESNDDVTSWQVFPTKADCEAAPSCYAYTSNFRSSQESVCGKESVPYQNEQALFDKTEPQTELSASQLKCYLPEGKTSLDDFVSGTAVGQTKAACEAASSSCFWSYKEDKSPSEADHKCHANTNSWMAIYTANNIPAPHKAYYQWVHYAAEVCGLRTDEECNADATCARMASICYASEPYLIGLIADACPTEAEFGAKLHNTTVHGAKVATGIVSPAGDVSRGALLFAALAALLALIM
jgi:hypothetical protein